MLSAALAGVSGAAVTVREVSCAALTVGAGGWISPGLDKTYVPTARRS